MRKERGDFEKYLTGDGIDIGAGRDALKVESGQVTSWDINKGDAQVLDGVLNDSFDFAYSSHCLEHMRDVGEALTNWARVVKPGGYLYIVVPDYLYYEKLRWPSVFNEGHNHTFSMNITREQVERDNHWNIKKDLTPLLKSIGVDVLNVGLELDGFNYNAGHEDQTMKDALSQLCIIAKKR